MTAFLRLKAQRQKPRLRPKLDVRGALRVSGGIWDNGYASVVLLRHLCFRCFVGSSGAPFE